MALNEGNDIDSSVAGELDAASSSKKSEADAASHKCTTAGGGLERSDFPDSSKSLSEIVGVPLSQVF